MRDSVSLKLNFSGKWSPRSRISNPCPRECVTIRCKILELHQPNKFSYCLTSYSWENRRASLALSRSIWSASSQTDMGGCSLIPKRENKTTRSGEQSTLYSVIPDALYRYSREQDCQFWDEEGTTSRGSSCTLMWHDPSVRFVLTYVVSAYVYPPNKLWISCLGGHLTAKNISLPLSAPVNISRLHAQLDLRKCSACVLFDEKRRGVRNREDLSLGFQWLRMNEQDWDA